MGEAGSKLFRDLSGADEMMAFGVNLAESASKALGDGFVHGLPHVAMVAIVAISSYYQQKQIQGRNPDAEIAPQQKMLMRIMPLMFVFFAFVSPAALVVYFVVSNLYRIGMQHYITRTLYHGEDSLGAQAHRATAEAKKLAEEHGGPELFPRLGKRKDAGGGKPDAQPPASSGTPPSGPNGADGAARGTPKPTSRTTGGSNPWV